MILDSGISSIWGRVDVYLLLGIRCILEYTRRTRNNLISSWGTIVHLLRLRLVGCLLMDDMMVRMDVIPIGNVLNSLWNLRLVTSLKSGNIVILCRCIHILLMKSMLRKGWDISCMIRMHVMMLCRVLNNL